MKNENQKISVTSRYLVLLAALSVLINTALGVMLTHRSNSAMKTQVRARMLDISNTAAAMIDGDVLRDITPKDQGTPGYESIMRILTYFQDNIELEYIYCIRDEGDRNFVFSIDPTAADPAEFGTSVVYTDALYRASRGRPSVDEVPYEDAWGSFYSAYSPVFDSRGKVAGIVAVDFDKAWYDAQTQAMARTTAVMCVLALALDGALVVLLIGKNRKRIHRVNQYLNQMTDSVDALMREVRIMVGSEWSESWKRGEEVTAYDIDDLDSLGRKISDMRRELHIQAGKVHEQACFDRTTSVMNKEYYASVQRDMDERIKAGRVEFSIVIFSMNELGEINRTYGQEFGDAALADAASVIASVFGRNRVFRTGGGEFRVIVEGMSDPSVRNSILKVDFRMATENIRDKSYQTPLSFSVGRAAFDREKDQSCADVYRRADRMMNEERTAYFARRDGA